MLNCEQGFLTTSTYAYILTRDQQFSQTNNYKQLRDNLADKWGLDMSMWIENDVINGVNCDYDEVVYL